MAICIADQKIKNENICSYMVARIFWYYNTILFDLRFFEDPLLQRRIAASTFTLAKFFM